MSNTVLLKDSKLTGVTVVDNAFIKAFLPTAPELALKAYLYGLMLLSGGASADADIAQALGCTDTDVLAAFSYWQSVGLVDILGESPLQIRFNNVSQAVARSGLGLASGARYADFVKDLQQVLGTRQLSGGELAKIYDWLEVFGMEQSAAIKIVSHCLEIKGARASVAYMDAMAKRLAGQGAVTAEQVEAAILDEQMMMSGAGLIIRRWRQKRQPTEDEIALYEKWTKGWGFDEEGISYACSKMTSAEKPSFSYLDSILADMHSEGTVSREQITASQKRDDSIREITREAFSRAGIKSPPSAEHKLQVKAWMVENGVGPELIYLAAELSKDRTHRFAFMRGVINEWCEKGLSSVPAARAYFEAYQKNKTYYPSRKNPALNYKQGGTYSRDELKKLGISLGEEFYSDD